MTSRLLVIAALVLGCASTSEPSVPAAGNVFRVELTPRRFGTIAAFIHDEAGLALAAEKSLSDNMQILGASNAVAQVDDRMLKVLWIGGACRFGPTVTLVGDTQDLRVIIRPEEGDGLPPGILCNAIGLFFGIDIQLSEMVLQEAVSVQVVR